jgi:thiamine pyridinylase
MPGDITRLLSAGVVIATLGSGCKPGAQQEPRQVLSVALFPFIPDAASDSFAAMRQRIERVFETENPSIDLRVRFFRGDWGYYVLDTLASWLSNPPEAGGYPLVEVDAILLGELVQRGLVGAWDALPRGGDWHPAALQSIQVGGRRYGVPHWLCGHYVFSRDPAVLKSLRALTAECRVGTEIPCLSGGAFHDDEHPDSAAILFANDRADATFGIPNGFTPFSS